MLKPYFCSRKINAMEKQYIDETHKDFAHNWVSSSRFLFFCQVFLVVAFILGGCYALSTHSYKGRPNVAVPESSQYNPKYKS